MAGESGGVAQRIDGKAIAERVRAEVRAGVERLRARGIVPGLATVLVGDDPASKIYVGSKEKQCLALGMGSFGHHLPASTLVGVTRLAYPELKIEVEAIAAR